MELSLPSETRTSSLVLRDYQNRLVEEIESSTAPTVVYMPTGAGKTEIACKLTKDEIDAGGTVLFICERKTLVKQSVKRFTKYGMRAGTLQGANTVVSDGHKIIVASVQTLHSRRNTSFIKSLLKNITLVLIDECHVMHRHHWHIVKECPGARLIGLSATPLKPDLNKLYTELVRGPGYADLIEQDYLVKPRYYLPSVDNERSSGRSCATDFEQKLSKVKVSSTGDYVNSELSKLMRKESTLKGIVDNWISSGEGRSTICFCVDKAHSKAVSEAFRAKGINASHIEDTTPDRAREEAWEAFRRGEVKVLCSVGVLSLGFDMPEASCVILARPTLSKSLHIQQIGRGLRVSPGKENCLIFDHALNLLKHDTVENFNPPELHELTKDKIKPTEVLDYKSCYSCNVLMNLNQTVCSECGAEKELSTVYREFLHIAKQKKYSKGWAYHKFVGMTGTKPDYSWSTLTPVEPSREVLRYVNICNAVYVAKLRKSPSDAASLRSAA